jgi:hypothetical protein
MSKSRGERIRKKILDLFPLTTGGVTTISDQFAVARGSGWVRLACRLTANLVHGTGTTPITTGLQDVIKAINFRTSNNEQILQTINGRELLEMNLIHYKCIPFQDTLAAVTGAYTFEFMIDFWDPWLQRPDDLLLDTALYNSLTMDVQVGTIADLLTTPGTDTVTFTLDCTAEVVRGRLPFDPAHKIDATPKNFTQLIVYPAIAQNAGNQIQIERSEDFWVRRIYVYTTTNAAGASLVPFSGVAADSVIQDLTIDTDKELLWNKERWEVTRNANQQNYNLATTRTGLNVIDFCGGGSIKESLWTADFSRVNIIWTPKSAQTGGQIQVLVEGSRKLKVLRTS